MFEGTELYFCDRTASPCYHAEQRRPLMSARDGSPLPRYAMAWFLLPARGGQFSWAIADPPSAVTGALIRTPESPPPRLTSPTAQDERP